MLNKTTKTTFNFVDDYGMMLRQDLFGTGENGERDSIGRTFEAAYCYGAENFDDAMIECWGEWKLWRHPGFASGKFMMKSDKYGMAYNDCSRDHSLYMCMYFNLVDNYSHKEIFDWKISDTANHTPDSYFYVKEWHYAYYVTQLAQYFFINLYFLFGGRPKVYSLYNTSWQVHLLKDSWAKRIIQKLLLRLSPEHNLAIRLLNGDKTVTWEQVNNYIPQTGDFWTCHYSEKDCKRIHRPLTKEQAEFNCIDKDLIVKLYNKTNER